MDSGHFPGQAGRNPAIALLNVLLRHWQPLLGATVGGAIVAGTVIAILGPRWESTSAVMPQSRRGGTNLAGLASQFGLAIPNMEGAPSPEFFAELAQSRPVLVAVAETPYAYRTPSGNVQGTLPEIFQSRGDSPAERRDAAIKRLSKAIRPSTSLKSGVMHLMVVERHPELARLINARVLAVLEELNRTRLQSQGREERRFADARATEARASLHAAEQALQRFEDTRRGWRQSADGVGLHDQLAREVTIRQTVYTGFVQAAEQAHVDEVRSTPTLMVVEPPSLADRPRSRHVVIVLTLGALAGLLLGILWRAALDAVQRDVAAGDPEAMELRRRMRRRTDRDGHTSLPSASPT